MAGPYSRAPALWYGTFTMVQVTSAQVRPPVAGPVAELQLPAVVPKSSAPSIGVLGQVDTLSEFEQIEYQACQAVLMMNSRSFVDIGQALATIHNDKLYRVEFQRFEDYCRINWGFSGRNASHLMAAAQFFTHLRTIGSSRQPDNERQLRPLVPLTPEQVKLAWETVVQRTGNGRISESRVKAAVKELGLAPAAPAVDKPARQNKAEGTRVLGRSFQRQT